MRDGLTVHHVIYLLRLDIRVPLASDSMYSSYVMYARTSIIINIIIIARILY